MIEELRAGQVIEYEHDPNDRGSYRADGALRRYMIIDWDARSGVVLVRDDAPRCEALPLDIVKKYMVVVREPCPLATPPVGSMTKDDVFRAVCDFNNHERECEECVGEVELCDPSERLKYLCPEGQKLLAWWGQRP